MKNLRLKLTMIENGVSQYRVAQVLACDPSFISRIVNGWIDPSDEVKQKIANFLEKPAEWLFQNGEKAKGVIMTYINHEDIDAQKNRSGFVPACQYGIGMDIEPKEIGGIFTGFKNPRLVNGIYVCDAQCTERIFLK